MTQVERAQEIVRELLDTGLDVLSHVGKEDIADLVSHLQGSEERVPRVSYITHWATALDITRHGLEGDPQKVRAYAELLLEKLTEDRQETIVKHLSRVLEGKKGALIYPANEGTLIPIQRLENALYEIVVNAAEALQAEGISSWGDGGRLGDALLFTKDTAEDALEEP